MIIFVCGAAVMVLELIGTRLFAPFFGTSLVVWASLIGVILGSLSLGYYLGGKLADRGPSYRVFALIIFVSALFIGLITFVQEPLLNYFQKSSFGLQHGTILATILLFAPPSILLGIVSPYAVKLKIHDLKTSGTTVGNLYAISTLGSIFGTFLAGFYLIARFGSRKIVIIIALTLILTAVLALIRAKSKKTLMAVIFFGIFLGLASFSYQAKAQKNIVDLDSQYNRIQVIKAQELISGRPLLLLKTDERAIQSMMYADEDNDLAAPYSKFYRLASHFNPEIKKALMIGGGAYSYPKEFLKKFPEGSIDVVEIDAKITEIAKKYFNLKDDPRLITFSEDGRTFLNKNEHQYDVVYVDAFSSIAPPYQLTTKETVQKISEHLNDKGVVLVNVVSAFDGEKGKFFRSEYKTYQEIFPQVYAFAISSPKKPFEVQNIMLVALKSNEKPKLTSDNKQLNSYLDNLIKDEIDVEIPVLTDDYAPVDQYLIKVIAKEN